MRDSEETDEPLKHSEFMSARRRINAESRPRLAECVLENMYGWSALGR